LKEFYTKTLKEKEELEKRLTKAKLLSEKISQLKQSENVMSITDQDKLEKEIMKQTLKIAMSKEAYLQIKNLEEKINQIRLSGNFLELETLKLVEEEIKTKQGAIEKSTSIRKEISSLQKNVDFLQDLEIDKLQKELDKVQLVFKEIQTSPGEVSKKISQEEMNAVLQVGFKLTCCTIKYG